MKTFNHYNINDYSNKVLKAQSKIKEFRNTKFDYKELRGLTKIEKEFIINNGNKITFIQHTLTGKKIELFLLIKRNLLGKKELYAITKNQCLRPNEQDLQKGILNHEILLKFDPKYNGFITSQFERSYGNNSRLIHLF